LHKRPTADAFSLISSTLLPALLLWSKSFAISIALRASRNVVGGNNETGAGDLKMDVGKLENINWKTESGYEW